MLKAKQNMQGEKFVQVYEQTPPFETPQNPFEEAIAPLDMAAHALGEWTYSYLSQPPEADGSMSGIRAHLPDMNRPPTFEQDFRSYVEWFRDNAGSIRGDITAERRANEREVTIGLRTGAMTEAEAIDYKNTNDMARIEADQKYNWHILASSMAPLWKPIMDGEWPKPGANNRDKFWWIDRAQENIAIQSMHYVQRRRQVAHAEQDYFQPSFGATRARSEGFGAELEDANLLLEVVKQAMLEDPSLELTVIPAPPQFESSDYKRIAKERGHEPKNPNVDFLIINLRTHEVAGWQSKTRLQQKVVNRYDTDERVVMSGTIDMGNVVRVRIPRMENGKEVETESSFPWIGGLAVRKALELSTYGPDTVSQFHYLFSDNQNGFNKSGKYNHKTKPNTGDMHSNSVAILKHAARDIAEYNHFDTDWVTDVRQAAQRPEVRKMLKRIGYTPKPDGYFTEAA